MRLEYRKCGVTVTIIIIFSLIWLRQPLNLTSIQYVQQSATQGSNDTADTLSRNNDVKTYKHIQLTRCISVISTVAESYGRPPTAQASKQTLYPLHSSRSSKTTRCFNARPWATLTVELRTGPCVWNRAGFSWWEAWGPVYLGGTERLQQLYD